MTGRLNIESQREFSASLMLAGLAVTFGSLAISSGESIDALQQEAAVAIEVDRQDLLDQAAEERTSQVLSTATAVGFAVGACTKFTNGLRARRESNSLAP